MRVLAVFTRVLSVLLVALAVTGAWVGAPDGLRAYTVGLAIYLHLVAADLYQDAPR